MTAILQAKPVVQALKEKIQAEVKGLKDKGITPTMGIIRVGQRPDDVYYENSIIKNCQSVGIEAKVYAVPETISMEEFVRLINQVNRDSDIHGILIFRPFPAHLDEDIVKHLIDPEKDIDCMNPVNLEKVFEGETEGLVPCTPAAVIETLKYYGYPLQGANVAVIGRSLVVGKPLAMMFLKENSTVTICHSRTKNMPDITKQADIVVAAIGKAKAIDEKYFTEKSVVIDVGINDAGDGKICGDVDYEGVIDKVAAITPVPGGVGTVTTTILLKHVLIACKKQTR
ncbi:MAG: Methylenetetrahydrofolate dehydrogenase / Methenyltetrahydrofolate cyclohydrolase [Peptococcaceae bacterium]|jgi:methylenetetrahydrofolate dehydrogenase (NADP+)/methenyltetrahydrofolate cyclohydrolase|nr:Methylenetetrahydrofolate dehydrogenase / Methenyltetrahydrofolate cyclohydrolase [Peptococcaceae bacterium]